MNLKAILENLPPFVPPVWAKSGHAQTKLAFLLPSRKLDIIYEEHLIPVPAFRTYPKDSLRGVLLRGSDDLVISLFHGLGGSSESTYMPRIGCLLHERFNASVFLINHRSLLYSSASSPDLGACFTYARRMFPNAVHIGIGFSLSANLILNLVGGNTNGVSTDLPDFAVSVNPPVNLKASSLLLKKGWNRIYDYQFLTGLKKRTGHQLKWDAKLWDFDETYTAPKAGFKNATEYYDHCSSLHYLNKIQTPTLIVMPNNDPFIRLDDLKNADVSTQVHRHFVNGGGHMGFLARGKSLGTYSRWLDEALSVMVQQLSVRRVQKRFA